MSNINFKVKNGLDVNGNIDVTNHNIVNVAAPVNATDAANKAYADAVSTSLTTHTNDATKHLTVAQNTWIDAITATTTEVNHLSGVTSSVQTQINGKVAKAGDTMTGLLILSGNPTNALGAATKQYVDSGDTTNATNLTNHIADQTLHLTAAQNTWIDAITASSAEVNYLVGVTSAIQTQLNTKEVAANKGVANGYASLDSSGKVPATQLPSYVDDVLEYANLTGMPATGETGKIYVAQDTNKIYRWTGSAYIEISPVVGNSDSATKLATARTIAATGDAAWFVTFDGTANVSSALTLANSGVSAGVYGDANNIPKVTVDSKGRITSVTNTPVNIPSGSLTFTGDVTGTGSTGSSTTLTLSNSGVAAGTYGMVTVDTKGRVTAGNPTSAVIVDATAPATATAGDLWFNSTTGVLQVYYVDINGGRWIDTAVGAIGYTGSRGATGYTGSAGPIGYTGSQGVIGYTGSQGVIGYTGSQGVIGYTGSWGPIGYTGSQGTQGPIGYTGSAPIDIASNYQTVAYTIALSDRGKSIDTTAGVNIPANATVAFPVGTTVTVTNMSGTPISITPLSGVTLRYAGTTSTGIRTLGPWGVATIRQVAADVWIASGAGLS